MFAVTVAFIVIATLVFVGYPLVRPPSGARAFPRPQAEDLAQLRVRLAELELDFHLGRISEEEYRRLRAEGEHRLREGGERR